MALSRSVTTDSDTADADQDIDALIGGSAWDLASVTFGFPDAAADYGYGSEKSNNFGAVTAAAQAVVRTVLGTISGLTDLGFDEIGDDPGEDGATAQVRVALTDQTTTGWAYYPSNGEAGGDVWLRNSAPGRTTSTGWQTIGFSQPQIGTWGTFTIWHELGHAMGLKHGHEASGPGAMTAVHDAMEFSVMTYRSYEGAGTGGYSNGTFDYAQSFMMYDIAALQRLYGADFTAAAGDTVYSFSTVTGEMFIDGAGQGTPGANRIFRTVWDGDGTDTYDLSNYTSALAIDLAPGGWSDFSAASNTQNANLGGGHYAQGHLYNALQVNGDARSRIENATGGAGDDTISGNAAANRLDGGAGADSLFGGAGADTLLGGDGDDSLSAGGAADRIEDGAGADRMAGKTGADVFAFVRDDLRDIVTDWQEGDLIDLSAWGLAGFGDLAVRGNGATVTILEAGGTESIRLLAKAGPVAVTDFDAGDFLFV